ncbi:hypothetical protein CR513_39920, partial [Mucuna pruriens]
MTLLVEGQRQQEKGTPRPSWQFKLTKGNLPTFSISQRFQKQGLPTSSLEECLGTLFGFVGEQVEIRGSIEIKTVFWVGVSAQTISVSYIVVNT